jgi:hypothetical protein
VAPDIPSRRGLCVLIVTVCFQSGVWSIKVNSFYAKTLLKTSAALHVMFEFFELEKMIGAHQRSSSNHSTYDRFKNCGETQKLSERLVSTGTSISREADVDGSRNED